MVHHCRLINFKLRDLDSKRLTMKKIYKYLGKVYKNHNFTLHCLRGLSMRYIQVLPGHKSSKATEIYIHKTK